MFHWIALALFLVLFLGVGITSFLAIWIPVWAAALLVMVSFGIGIEIILAKYSKL